ncbi:preprotein translocase subunit SecG [bacterium]|nr:preprotein translocase subunit SecG [bacterium]
MNYLQISKIAQIVFAILLTLLILLQSKGGGLTSGIGNSIGMYRSRRGVEKTIFIFTIGLAILLVVNSLLIIVLS